MKKDRTSRYRKVSQYSEDGRRYVGTRPLIEFPENSGDDFHTLIEGERLDQVAWRYYKDSRLWWVIAEANGILNPLNLKAGKRLRIPSQGQILRKVAN